MPFCHNIALKSHFVSLIQSRKRHQPLRSTFDFYLYSSDLLYDSAGFVEKTNRRGRAMAKSTLSVLFQCDQPGLKAKPNNFILAHEFVVDSQAKRPFSACASKLEKAGNN